MIDETTISIGQALEQVLEEMENPAAGDRNMKMLNKLQNILSEKKITMAQLIHIKQDQLLDKKHRYDPDTLPRFNMHQLSDNSADEINI